MEAIAEGQKYLVKQNLRGLKFKEGDVFTFGEDYKDAQMVKYCLRCGYMELARHEPVKASTFQHKETKEAKRKTTTYSEPLPENSDNLE